MSKGFGFSYNYIANLYAFYLTVSDISNQYSIEVIGLVDTGSDVSLISQNVIRELHLEKVGNRSVDTAQGTYQSDEYFVNVKLSDSFMVNNLKVSSTIMDNADFIMGTDILSKGDLLIENSGGKTKITFTLNWKAMLNMNNKAEECIMVKPYSFPNDRHLCVSVWSSGKKIYPPNIQIENNLFKISKGINKDRHSDGL